MRRGRMRQRWVFPHRELRQPGRRCTGDGTHLYLSANAAIQAHMHMPMPMPPYILPILCQMRRPRPHIFWSCRRCQAESSLARALCRAKVTAKCPGLIGLAVTQRPDRGPLRPTPARRGIAIGRAAGAEPRRANNQPGLALQNWGTSKS